MSSTQQQRQAIHSIHNKKFWTEFFCLYKSLPALWDVNSPLYKNRQLKITSYDVMIEKLREIEPNSDREDVLRKINIFRTNYRRELSRISLSRSEGRQYKSTLWYFELLSFLQMSDARRERRKRKLDDDGEKSIMRKRRNISTSQKAVDKFLISSNKKPDLGEFQTPSSDIDFDYDKYEEPDFDYVVDLSDALVETKVECGEIVNSLEDQQANYEDENEDGEDNSHNEYDHKYQHFQLPRNIASPANSQSSKVELTSQEISTANTTASNDNVGENVQEDDLILQSGIHFQDHAQPYDEYESDGGTLCNGDEGITTETQWGNIKTQTSQQLSSEQTVQDNSVQIHSNSTVHDPVVSTSTASNYNENPISMTTKFVRDVKTMTFGETGNCYHSNRISESSEIIAKSWAIQYDELTQDQKVLARKAINDILFEGCLGHLAIGPNGRVITGNSGNNMTLKSAQNVVQSEVESGEVYGQTMTSTSSVVPMVNNNNANNEKWLKL